LRPAAARLRRSAAAQRDHRPGGQRSPDCRRGPAGQHPRQQDRSGAAGEVIGVVRTGSATCPVAAVQAWQAAVNITEGWLFRRINRHGRLGAALIDQSAALIPERCAGRPRRQQLLGPSAARQPRHRCQPRHRGVDHPIAVRAGHRGIRLRLPGTWCVDSDCRLVARERQPSDPIRLDRFRKVGWAGTELTPTSLPWPTGRGRPAARRGRAGRRPPGAPPHRRRATAGGSAVGPPRPVAGRPPGRCPGLR
jgi:hypothetical protein